MSFNLLPTGLLALVMASACSGSGDPGEVKPEAVVQRSAGTEPIVQEPESQNSDRPAMVAGSFLTYCSRGVALTGEGEGARDEMSCMIKDADGKRMPDAIATIAATAVAVSGHETPLDARVAASAAAPWHFHFRLPPAVEADLQSVRIAYSFPSRPGVAYGETVSLEQLAWAWQSDPLFQAILVAFAAKPDPKVRPDPTKAQHFLFVTDRVYAGDFGADKADAICQEAGAKVLPDRSWVAVLSSPKKDARDKIEIQGAVANMRGDFLGAFEGFWGPRPYAVGLPKFTETGRNINRVDLELSPPRFLTRVWTASRPDGTYDAKAGACNGFTTADKAVTGGVGQAGSEGDSADDWISRRTASCAEVARLLCISLAVPAS